MEIDLEDELTVRRLSNLRHLAKRTASRTRLEIEGFNFHGKSTGAAIAVGLTELDGTADWLGELLGCSQTALDLGLAPIVDEDGVEEEEEA